MSQITIDTPLVSVDWLHDHLGAENIIILDATIPKVTEVLNSEINQKYIPNTLFFDLKQKFSDTTAPFPSTIPSEAQFTEAAQLLGINQDSTIIVYDDKGIYSSPRAWWLFKSMGHANVAVLDGGLPQWIHKGYLTTSKRGEASEEAGNFKAKYDSSKMRFFDDMQNIVSDNSEQIIDARSVSRFNGEASEPRAGLRGGHIPNSHNLPYTHLLNGNVLKSKAELNVIFDTYKNGDKVFTCGSGITACILALGAELSGYKNIAVYDGSWTEWGSLTDE